MCLVDLTVYQVGSTVHVFHIHETNYKNRSNHFFTKKVTFFFFMISVTFRS